MWLASVCKFLGHDHEGDTQDGAVRGDKGQENTQCLIKRRTHFLQHNLHHLHEGGDDKDECNRLHELDMQRHQHIILEKICHKCGKSDDEAYGPGHSGRGAQLV